MVVQVGVTRLRTCPLHPMTRGEAPASPAAEPPRSARAGRVSPVRRTRSVRRQDWAPGVAMGGAEACCETADCPSPQCQSCQNGVCVAAKGGQICGMSTTSGGATRCCNGSCPDLVCVPVGASGPSCSPGDSCTGVNCCSHHPSICVVDQCNCLPSLPGESSGSDADCASNTTAKACICGTCQAPPV